jgi:hypothetical protein
MLQPLTGRFLMATLFWIGLVLPFSPQAKAQSQLTAKQASRWAPALSEPSSRLAFQKVYIQSDNPSALEAWVVTHLPKCRIQSTARPGVVALTGLTASDWQKLPECPLIRFVDVAGRTAQPEGDLRNYDLSLNQITLAHAQFPALTGQGLAASVKENPFDKNDIDFKGRVISPGLISAETFTTHATNMAGLIAGGGNSSPFSKGTAWQAGLASSDFTVLLPDSDQSLLGQGVSVQNHSYGVGIENYYGLEAQEYDKQCQQIPTLVHVFSSGNAGNQSPADGAYKSLTGLATLTGQFKQSKNTLSVGAVDKNRNLWPLSSRGPAYDGRVKPELVAYGDGGTSESAALVSGICLLVQQAYQAQYTTLPPAALVKAILINSADDVGKPGPDFETGYGNANAAGAIRTVTGKRTFTGEIEQGESQTVSIAVPSGVSRLKITLAWADPAALPNASMALVNDLDLKLAEPATGRQWLPWVLNSFPHPDSLAQRAQRKEDHLNTIEQITIDSPNEGLYRIQVDGHAISSGKQSFGIAYDWETDAFEWLNPRSGSVFQANRENSIRWKGKTPAASGKLDYRFSGASTWQPIADLSDLSIGAWHWIPPDTNARIILRLQSAGQSYLSDTVTVFRPLDVKVGYQCANEALLHWQPVAGAIQYQVFRMGATALEPFEKTADTLLFLNATEKQAVHYAVAPVFPAYASARSLTLDYTQQGTGCYFRSFLARNLVTDTVWLDAELSTLYRLQSATLERWTNGSFEEIQTVSPLPGTRLEFRDASAQKGLNQYRIRLRTETAADIFSDVENVYYLTPGESVVFPNPVAAGAAFYIANAGTGNTRIQVFDMHGRLLADTMDAGRIKTLSTSHFTRGMYLIRIRNESGPTTTQRLIIR